MSAHITINTTTNTQVGGSAYSTPRVATNAGSHVPSTYTTPIASFATMPAVPAFQYQGAPLPGKVISSHTYPPGVIPPHLAGIALPKPVYSAPVVTGIRTLGMPAQQITVGGVSPLPIGESNNNTTTTTTNEITVNVVMSPRAGDEKKDATPKLLPSKLEAPRFSAAVAPRLSALGAAQISAIPVPGSVRMQSVVGTSVPRFSSSCVMSDEVTNLINYFKEHGEFPSAIKDARLSVAQEAHSIPQNRMSVNRANPYFVQRLSFAPVSQAMAAVIASAAHEAEHV